MKEDVVILVVEDDPGHAKLIEKNLRRAGIRNEIQPFSDGQSIIDFLFGKSTNKRVPGRSYLMLLDIRMPKIDGVEVLRRVREDAELRKLPVIMISTTDDPMEIALCHELGCSVYVTKPIDSEKFIEAIRKLGLFFKVIQVPAVE